MTFQAVLFSNGSFLFQYQNISNIGSFSETIGAENSDGSEGVQYIYNSPIANQSSVMFVPKTTYGIGKPMYVKNVLISTAKDLNLSVYKQGGGRIQIPNATRAEIIPDPATVSFKIIKGVNTTVIKFYNLNTTSSRTLNLSVVLRASNGSIVNAAFLNTSTLIIAPNSSASILLTVNATDIPVSIYSGRITALADNGERAGVIFGFTRMNELKINKIKFDGAPATYQYVWVYKTNATRADSFSRFVSTDLNGTATVFVPDGEYNIWSAGSFNNTWIWSTKDKLPVFGKTVTTLDERLSLPVSFNPNKSGQKFASLFSVLAYSDYYGGYGWTIWTFYPSNTTTRVTPTSVNLAHSYEYYPAAYYNSSDSRRINTPEWHHLYFSEQGINSPRNYAADYSKLVRRNGVYKTALVNESAWRYEWVTNETCICWAFGWNMDLPQNRTEYITPDTYYLGALSPQNWSLGDWEHRSYPPASTPTESWNAQPFSWEHYISRGSNWLYISGQVFKDTDKHMYSSYPVPGNFTLYRNDIKIYNVSTTDYFGYYNSSEPGTASYSAMIEGKSNQNLSIRSLTMLNFSYTGSGDYMPPKMLMKVPKLDLYNRLPGSSAEINLTIIEENEFGAVNGTPGLLASKSLEYSTNDGAGWNALSLTHTGNGEYTATISGLANNTFVSLRAKAQDNSGNNASHELIRAFLVSYAAGRFGPKVYIDPPYQSVIAGNTFNITIKVDPDNLSISGGEVKLKFNVSAFQVQSITKGDILGSDAFDTGSGYNNTAGTVRAVLARLGTTTGHTSPGAWAAVSFKALLTAKGNHTIEITNAGLGDASFEYVTGITTTDGTVKVITLVGDINGDCKVDYKDLAILGAAYGTSKGDTGFNASADLNGDGIVDYIDLAKLGANYGKTC